MTFKDTVASTAQSIGDRSLSALKSSDDAVVHAARRLAGAVRPVTGRVRTSPVLERLPEGRKVVERVFSYAEKLLAEQKRFSLDLAGTFARPGVKKAKGSGTPGTTKAA